MATITTIDGGDQISDSRSDINTNFANLNSDKIETSAIDTDTALAANSDAKIPSQKAVKAYIDAGGNPFAVETTTGTTHSLTTIAGQRVVVWVKCEHLNSSSNATITLKYNSVIKDTIALKQASSDDRLAVSLMYTETPGAATQNITVETSAGSLANTVIIVFKINV